VFAGTSGERVLTYPRGDLRRSTQRMPSRFLRDSVEALHGARLSADELERLDAPWCTHVPSFAAGVARAAFPADEQEYRLRELLDHTEHGQSIDVHPSRATDTAFDRALDATLSRASRRFTRFDGNLAHLDVASPADPSVVVSPTRLEAWATCPHTYLMDSVLRVEIPERPEEVYEMQPIDKGNLVHQALDEFVREILARDGGAPAWNEPWTPTDRERLHAIGAARCDAYEDRGLTGRPVFWARARRRILAELDQFLTADDRERGTEKLVPIASEFSFGIRGVGTPIEIELSDGRSLRFRGAVDRVDRANDGALVVVDYKTGKREPYNGISEADPDVCGRRLQLPVYARAVQREFGDAATPVEAAYWFVSARGQFKKIGLPLTRVVADRIDTVLRTIVDNIERGVFPCRVDPPDTSPFRNRDYVDPDSRGTRDRYRDWLRKREAPELRSYVELAEPALAEAAS
jgi:hypothetical protein